MIENTVGLLAALSVSSERLVEIVKGFVPFLNQKSTDPKTEARRKVALQILAVVAGIVTTILAYATHSIPQGDLPPEWGTPIGIFTVGLLASGGAGFWNAILTYVLQVKNIKAGVAAKQG